MKINLVNPVLKESTEEDLLRSHILSFLLFFFLVTQVLLLISLREHHHDYRSPENHEISRLIEKLKQEETLYSEYLKQLHQEKESEEVLKRLLLISSDTLWENIKQISSSNGKIELYFRSSLEKPWEVTRLIQSHIPQESRLSFQNKNQNLLISLLNK